MMMMMMATTRLCNLMWAVPQKGARFITVSLMLLVVLLLPGFRSSISPDLDELVFCEAL